MNKFYFVLCTLIIFTSCKPRNQKFEGPNRFADPKLLEIAKLQDQLNGKELKKYINAKKEIHRYYASLAYATVQDTNAIPYLSLRIQTDRSKKVRMAAAYALGQIRHDKASPALIEGIGIEIDPEVRATMIEALGKIGTEENLKLILSLKSRDTITDAGIMRGLFQLLMAGQKSKEMAVKAMKAFDGNSIIAKKYAAQIMVRGQFKLEIKPKDVEYWLNIFKENKDAELGISLAKMLGQFSEWIAFGDVNMDSLQSRILSFAKNSSNPVQQAFLLSSANKYKNLNLNDLQRFIDQAHPQVLKVIRENILNEDNMTLINEVLENKTFDKYSAELYKVYMVFMHHNRDNSPKNLPYISRLKEEYKLAKNRYTKINILKTLSADIANFKFVHYILRSEKDAPVKGAALESLNAMYENPSWLDEAERNIYENQILTSCLKNDDIGLRTIACYGIMNVDSKEKYLPMLDSVSRELKLPIDLEAYLTIKELAAEIRGLKYKKPKPKYNHPVNWDAVKLIPDTCQVLVKTSKGEMVFQCLVNEAPASVWNFLSLVDSGFYNNKTFHRMITGFVIQGGCSRGDGWGAPNWSQRAEFSNFLNYEIGMVGLASVGAHTEGFQWFVSHCDVPHLTGRYTIFAKVIKGIDVMSQLDVGDQIIEVKRL